MRTIPIQQSPNQAITVTLDGNRWALTIKTANDTMCVDVDLNDTPILRGQRAVAGMPVIPYRRLAAGQGNFMFVTERDETPWWERFTVDQSLHYVTAEDVA